jgi:spore coat polysaccharide biosynthesis protein SpsF (cytidylyltransferase family)
MKIKVGAIIQARIGSTRYPGKVLEKIDERTVLEFLLERLSTLKEIDSIIIAIPKNQTEHKLYSMLIEKGYTVFRGDENNVICRVLDAAKENKIDIIVDITADCPLVDLSHVKGLIYQVKDNGYDYASNISPRTWPDGFDVQVYHKDLLKDAKHAIDDNNHYSHVGWNILHYRDQIEFNINKILTVYNITAGHKYRFPQWGLTLDEPADLIVIKKIVEHFADHPETMNAETIIEYIKTGDILKHNAHVVRKEPGKG